MLLSNFGGLNSLLFILNCVFVSDLDNGFVLSVFVCCNIIDCVDCGILGFGFWSGFGFWFCSDVNLYNGTNLLTPDLLSDLDNEELERWLLIWLLTFE